MKCGREAVHLSPPSGVQKGKWMLWIISWFYHPVFTNIIQTCFINEVVILKILKKKKKKLFNFLISLIPPHMNKKVLFSLIIHSIFFPLPPLSER